MVGSSKIQLEVDERHVAPEANHVVCNVPLLKSQRGCSLRAAHAR